ncbi:MAG: valine--tRNA ligase [Patescibacteria group bacterium]
MDKAYEHQKYEKDIYEKWMKSGAFEPKGEGKPFSIIMPPPNANGELHLGHATFIAISDILIRYKRMNGSPTLWLPGVDHAGIQTQVTFEKKLLKDEKKSRHDLGRDEFYKRCYEFAIDCKVSMENQMKGLGASCDWSREKFTLDPQISDLVYETFIKMHKDGLVYRGYRIVNWCPRCRSTLADVELEHNEQTTKLYYVRYPKTWEEGCVVVATTRPEPIWVDTHLAVNPKDKKNNHLVGKTVKNPLTGAEMEIIGEEFVEPGFGTGVVKMTPAHDMTDFEVAQKLGLPINQAVDFDGRMTKEAGKYAGMKTKEAREVVVSDLTTLGLIERIDENYVHAAATCERCGTVIEPLVSRQWFISTKKLAEPAIAAVEEGRIKITPEKYEKMYFNWMRSIRDWPISRQIWWGHQLPVWYRKSDQLTGDQLSEWEKLKNGDTRARTDALESPIVSIEKPEGDEVIQDPDTFDTWFSSGQWPINTLKTSGVRDFEKFYPTTVMNTAYEILFLWVARMIMFGLYLTGEVPFETALINGVLRDNTGAKMSKSKGNGVNPNEAIEKYGADAVRMGISAGRDNGNDLLISKQQMEERIRGYRNFSNKMWNSARYVEMMKTENLNAPLDLEFENYVNEVVKKVTSDLEKYRIGQAAETVYEEFWHWFCDKQINLQRDGQVSAAALSKGLKTFLKLVHPFMPFVTEAIWSELGEKEMLITSKWPSK